MVHYCGKGGGERRREGKGGRGGKEGGKGKKGKGVTSELQVIILFEFGVGQYALLQFEPLS